MENKEEGVWKSLCFKAERSLLRAFLLFYGHALLPIPVMEAIPKFGLPSKKSGL
jgi:hypothetical protein